MTQPTTPAPAADAGTGTAGTATTDGNAPVARAADARGEWQVLRELLPFL